MFAAILILIASALALSLILTPVVRKAALRWGLVDMPDGGRKVHRRPVPRIGGIAVFVAYFGSCLALTFGGGHQFTEAVAALKSFAPAAVVVFVTGLVDDIFGLRPWQKLAAEIVAGILVVSGGMSIPFASSLPGHPVVAAVCTIVWLVACVNAVNLIDGLDGLASGIGLLATMVILFGAIFHGSLELAIVAAPLLGALVGFLVFNFNPASIFLGDSGSLLIGFLLGCYGILWCRDAQTASNMAAPVVALALPLVDTSLAIIRRFLRSRPIFSPDRSHIHHRLLAYGFTQRRAVLVLYAVAGAAGVVSLCLAYAEKHWAPFILVAFAGATWFGIRRLRYAEIETASHVLTGSAFRREVSAQLAVQQFEQNLAGAATANDCWEAILEGSPEFGFEPTRMELGGQIFVRGPGADRYSAWGLHLPISQNDWIELAHEPGTAGHVSAAIPFIEAIRNLLNSKTTTLPPRPQRSCSLPLASVADVSGRA